MEVYSGPKLPPMSSKYPWFVVQNLNDEDDIGDEIYSTLHDPLIKYQYRIPGGRRIRACFHGWLILSNHPQNDIWSLWNPLTLKIIHLPPLTLKNGDGKSIDECCLTAPPDDPTSILLLTRSDQCTFVFCQLDYERMLSWSELSYAKQLKRLTHDGRLLRSLTYCNGKIYALNANGYFRQMVVQVDVVVNKGREVMIKLLVFGVCPNLSNYGCFRWISILKGYGTKLFNIRVGFHDKTKKVDDVYLFELDTTCIKWDEMECLNKWDLTDILSEDVQLEHFNDLEVMMVKWDEIDDLKDAIFYVDVARDISIYYNPEIASELGGGYIHIRDNLEGVIYLYHVKDKTVIPFLMPSRVVSTTHVFMWEGRLEDDHEAKYTVNSKQEYSDGIVVKSTTKTYDEAELNESCGPVIPFDVLQMIIMEYCVGVEYMNFRATCKLCYLAAPPIRWRNTTTRLHNYSPWLMVVEKNHRRIITFTDPMTGNNYFMKKSRWVSIVNAEIICSRFGWLLFDCGERECYKCLVLFNPFKSDVRKLPKTHCKLKGVCFSAAPTSPNCIVAGFTTKNNHCRVVFNLVNRESFWRKLRVGVDPYSICSSTFYGRDLYALCTDGELIVLKDLGKKDYSRKIVKAESPPLSSCSSPAQYYIVKCDEHLLLVIVGKFGQMVEVCAYNKLSDKWEEIDSVGKHMIYICGKMCFCVEAKKPEMENKIYFSHLHWKNDKIFCYSLETHKYHAIHSKPTSIILLMEKPSKEVTMISLELYIIKNLMLGLNQLGVS